MSIYSKQEKKRANQKYFTFPRANTKMEQFEFLGFGGNWKQVLYQSDDGASIHRSAASRTFSSIYFNIRSAVQVISFNENPNIRSFCHMKLNLCRHVGFLSLRRRNVSLMTEIRVGGQITSLIPVVQSGPSQVSHLSANR